MPLLMDHTFRMVAAGSAILGIVCGLLGSLAVLKKQSLLGDGISHAALPGVVLAYLISGSRQMELLLLGAFCAGLLSALCIHIITRYSHLPFDTALALVMSVFFGLGLMLLTYAQKRPDAQQAGLSRFLFGQASAIVEREVLLMLVLSAGLLALVLLFWKEWRLLCFDPAYAASLGLPVHPLERLLSLLLVGAIVLGLQTVGVVLMSALLIAPAVAARQWCRSFGKMLALAALFGMLSGVSGTAVSSLIPRLPTGPAIVVFASLLVILSLLFAPGRGLIARLLLRKQQLYALKKASQP